MKLNISEHELKADRDSYAKFRRTKIGSSDASIIMNQSPWKSPYQLWLDKTGRSKSVFAPSLNAQYGIQFEATIRSEIEMKLDMDFPDQMFTSDKLPYMMSSTDGFNDEHQIILEIKAVLGPQTYEKAAMGLVSEVYIPQLQHQLWVTEAKKTLFYVAKLFKERDQVRVVDKVLVEVLPDLEYQETMIQKCIEFYNLIANDTPPPLTERDAQDLDGADDVAVFAEIKALKDAGVKFDLQKAKAIEIAKKHHTYVRAGGIKLKCTNGVWRCTYANEKD